MNVNPNSPDDVVVPRLRLSRAEQRRAKRATARFTKRFGVLHPSGVSRAGRRSQIREATLNHSPQLRAYRKQTFGRWRRAAVRKSV